MNSNTQNDSLSNIDVNTFTVENVMDYLKQEGYYPEIDEFDSRVIIFKFQDETISIVVQSDFCKCVTSWAINVDRNDVNAIKDAIQVVNNKLLHIIQLWEYDTDTIVFDIEHRVTSIEQFKQIFKPILELAIQCQKLFLDEYVKITGTPMHIDRKSVVK